MFIMKNIYNIHLFFAIYLYRLFARICCVFLRSRNASDGVLFLENFPIENAGYHYRAGKWKTEFEKKGLRCEVWTIFPDKNDFEVQFGNMPLLYIRAMRKRFRQCVFARKFKTVIVRRELLQFNDYGNLFMERFLLKIHPNVMLDFDDDISASKREPRTITSIYGKLLGECGNKFNDSLRLYKRFVVGSNYLKNKVLLENKSINSDAVLVVPTCVDYNKSSAKIYNNESAEVVLGWIGGNHNLHYLDMLVEPLNKLVADFKFKLFVVAGQDYVNESAKFKIENQQWSLKTEKKYIKNFDIGLMPIYDNAVGRGKCGFKLLQYMGLGVVGVATNVAVNGEIIEDGKNGFLVKSDNSNWYEVLKKVLSLQNEYSNIGMLAKKTVQIRYSFESNLERYIRWVS